MAAVNGIDRGEASIKQNTTSDWLIHEVNRFHQILVEIELSAGQTVRLYARGKREGAFPASLADLIQVPIDGSLDAVGADGLSPLTVERGFVAIGIEVTGGDGPATLVTTGS